MAPCTFLHKIGGGGGFIVFLGKLPNKTIKVWFWGFWDDFLRSEIFDLDHHNGGTFWFLRSKFSDPCKSSQNPWNHTLNRFFVKITCFSSIKTIWVPFCKFPAEILGWRGSNWPPPPEKNKSGLNFETQNIIYNPISNFLTECCGLIWEFSLDFGLYFIGISSTLSSAW